MPALEKFQTANWIRRINRVAQILLGISFIAGLNYLATRHFTRLDLTREHFYSLSPETLAYISQLKNPVKIIVTIPPDSEEEELKLLYRYVKNLLKEYVFAGRDGKRPKIEVEFIDIYKEIKKADAISRNYGIEQPYEILIVSGDRKRALLPTDILEIKDGKPSAFRGEQAFTSALIEVSSNHQDKIYFTVGHGEFRINDADPRRGISQLTQELNLRNFAPAPLDLTQSKEVPEDADLVVIASPQGPFRPHETEKLRNYLSERAGRLIVLIDPWRKHGLEDLFYDWGVLADDMLIFDDGPDFQQASGDLLIRQFAQHPITNLLLKNKIPVVVGLSRPVRKDPGGPLDQRLRIVPLLGSSPSSWAEKSYREIHDVSELHYNPATDLKGPVPIATVSERKVSSPFLSISGGRLVVFGNSDLMSNQRIGSFGNYMLILNTINWCLDRDKMLAIPPRPIERYQILLSRSELNQLGLILLLLPGAVALMGLTVYWVRRG